MHFQIGSKYWFWVKRWSKIQWDGKSQASWGSWESSWLLVLAFARRRWVSLRFHRVICLRHVKTAAVKSWGRSLPATVTMAWLRARRGSPPPVLHRQTSTRSWLVRAFCMEIGLSSRDLLLCVQSVQSHWLWNLVQVEVCEVGSTSSLVGFGYILICLGKGDFISFIIQIYICLRRNEFCFTLQRRMQIDGECILYILSMWWLKVWVQLHNARATCLGVLNNYKEGIVFWYSIFF